MRNDILPVDRFLATLAVVAKEAKHLEWSRSRLFRQTIDTAWVESLENRPELAEQLEAFVSRYGRLQDTIGDKLLPRWLLALAERLGSHRHMVFPSLRERSTSRAHIRPGGVSSRPAADSSSCAST
jgi:hypothetical protein